MRFLTKMKNDRPYIIAGPCSLESEEQIFKSAEEISKLGIEVLRAGIWKPRTHPGSFEGIGDIGVKMLKEAALRYGLKCATEVANPKHIESALKGGIDILWIGARTTGNPFMVSEIASALSGADIPVMVKNPLNPDIELWCGAIERLTRSGLSNISALHRGFYSYTDGIYRNPPMWHIPVELRRRFPKMRIICDPSHICGDRRLVEEIAQQAVTFGFDGLMIECHPTPELALSDAGQQVTPLMLGEIISRLKIPVSNDRERDFDKMAEELRSTIDSLDETLIDILARRMDAVRSIGSLKRKMGLPVLQPQRWNNVLESALVHAKEHSLDTSFIEKIFTLIHEESMKNQVRQS